MHLGKLDLAYWAAGFVGHITLFYVLIWKKRVGTHPVFSAFIVMNILRTVTLYLVRDLGTTNEYSYTFWSLAVLDVVLQFGVLYELTAHIFRSSGIWAPYRRQHFAGLVVVSLVVTIFLTWLASPPAHGFVDEIVIRGKYFSSVCMIAIFVGLLLFSANGGRPWKTHDANIALGFGAYSIASVLIDAAHNYFGLQGDNHIYIFLSHMRIAVYICCLVFWIAVLWQDEAVPRKLTEQMRLQLSEFRRRVDEDFRAIRSERQ